MADKLAHIMKLEKDLVRRILLDLEADNGDPRDWKRLEIDGHTHQEIAYHVQRLAEAGFVKATDASSSNIYDWMPQSLTYEGHEFLDTVRDPEIWRETKERASKIGSASLQILFEVATGIVKAKAMRLLGS